MDEQKKILEKLQELLIGQTELKNELNHKIDSFKTTIKEELNVFNNKISDVENRMGKVEESQGYISTQYDNIEKNNESVIKKQQIIEKDLVETRNTVKELELKIEELLRHNDQQENQGRKNMLEIEGLPVSEAEKGDRHFCKTLAVRIHQLMGLQDHHGIDIAHKTQSNNIIVLFTSRYKRDEFYFGRFNLKGKSIADLGYQKSENSKGLIWVNESLTGRRKYLLSTAKTEIRKRGFVIGRDGCSVYSMLGQVKVKYMDTTRKINSDDDIIKCLNWLGGQKQG